MRGHAFTLLLCLWGWRTIAAMADGLAITSLMPKSVCQGEPVVVAIRIENVSRDVQTIFVPSVRRFGPDTVAFQIQNPGDTNYRHVQHPDIYVGGLKVGPPRSLPLLHLKPAESVEYSFPLVYDFVSDSQRRWLFGRPGHYMIRIDLFAPTNVQQSESSLPPDTPRRVIQAIDLGIDVVPWEDPREREAFESLVSISCEYLIYDPFALRMDCHREAIREIQSFFTKYDSTYLGRRAVLPLGVAVYQRMMRDESGDIEKTLKELGQSEDLELRALAREILARIRADSLQPKHAGGTKGTYSQARGDGLR